ncbi:hypothetical protein V5O48_014309 [Marasmius crinis-equi]|uniref:Uncharacterized protein n=1 Tax=Marasmius crinis-equi TaxID=585013 RepID=A0ABR3EXP9_9AGAR
MASTWKSPGLRRLSEIVKDYPTSITVIEHLRRTRLPNATSFDLSHPGDDVNSVLVAIMALVKHLDSPRSLMAIVNTEKYWSPVLRPWAVFLLSQICRREPSTPEGFEASEIIRASIPPILALPQQRRRDVIHPVSHSSDPTIKPLVVQIWLQAVERHHISWGPWSALMTCMAESWPALLTSLGYTNDSDLGPTFLRHLNHLSEDITTLPTSSVSNMANFLSVISLGGNVQKSSLGCGRLRGATIAALVRVISGLIRK